MSKFCDLNLNGTNLSSKDLNQLIEFALKRINNVKFDFYH